MIENPNTPEKTDSDIGGSGEPMTPEEQTRHELYSQWIVSSKEAKAPIEWEWFVRKNFLEGNHWIKFNKDTNSLEQLGEGNKFKTTINKVYTITRAVRNYVTKHQPKWEVIAQDIKAQVYNKSVASERFLDVYWFEEQIKKKMKEVVGDAMWASVGYMWFWWDATKRWLCADPVEPFDLFPDPTSKDTLAFSDALFLFRAIPKKERELQDDTRFKNKGLIVADNKLAESDMKVTLLQLTSGLNLNAWSDKKDLETVMTYEGYVKLSEPNSKGGMYDHVILTPTAEILYEETKFKDMPCRAYHTDIETGRQYTQGWVKNLIGPQKILDTLESNTLEFNHVISKGRFVTDKGSGVGIVVNKNGQIIEKNRGSYFQQLPMQSQPVTVENQIMRASRYMEDIGASHDAFVGRMPSGANSGVAIDTLLSGEENNLTDLRDNLADWLISTAKFILKAYSIHLMEVVTFFTPVSDQKELAVNSVTGKQSPIKQEKQDVTFNKVKKSVEIERILEENNIRVTVGTWLGTGKTDSRKELMELYDKKIVDQQTVLEYYNAPNIPSIIENTKKRMAEEAAMQAAVQSPPGTMPAININPTAGGGANPAGNTPAAGGMPTGLPGGMPPSGPLGQGR